MTVELRFVQDFKGEHGKAISGSPGGSGDATLEQSYAAFRNQDSEVIFTIKVAMVLWGLKQSI